ncbi:glycosyltransferase family 2 protein [Flavobacterium sp. 3HN19-14]|uniref:glycosyltransferase family 2 protein n=1 Tax=Flavobacterium sp. 3HN19-14 TaxID=3448133 RepID=UPI003EE05665
MCKISVITINYNDAAGLEKTILSVLNQNCDDFEFIVIDGNSTDGSKNIIEKYAGKLTFSVSEPDNGIYNAMNKGINAAKGEYLLFMNSGDILVDDAEILNKCLLMLNADVVAFDCFLSENDKITDRRTHLQKPTLFYVYQYGLKHQSTFIKKSLFEKFGLYNEKYKIAGDYEFWMRCFLQPETSAVGYDLPIAIFALGGISQNADWSIEHKKTEQEWLPHLVDDFHHFKQLTKYEKSRLLTTVVKFQKSIRKIFR